jgi:hypothetical protein
VQLIKQDVDQVLDSIKENYFDLLSDVQLRKLNSYLNLTELQNQNAFSDYVQNNIIEIVGRKAHKITERSLKFKDFKIVTKNSTIERHLLFCRSVPPFGGLYHWRTTHLYRVPCTECNSPTSY